MRNHFKHHYLEYKECYKCYSILFPVGEVFTITTVPFSLFVNQVNVIDQFLSPIDVNLKWAATTQSMIKKENFRTPERGIVRFQFMEVITRLAEQKYLYSNICESYFEALQKMYTENLKPEFERCSSQGWRV